MLRGAERATPGYFETMGIRLRDGRLFNSSDVLADSASRVVVINEALAKKYFPGENPVGRRMGGGLNGWVRVIGVVSNVAEAALTDEREPVRYYPAAQMPWFGNLTTFVVRTTRPADAPAVLDDARRTIQRVAPGFAVQGTTTMDRVFDTAVGPARQIMSLLALLSSLALLLGATGIYGVISHFAARRKRDWAIRVALGLPGSRVVSHIVRQGVVPADHRGSRRLHPGATCRDRGSSARSAGAITRDRVGVEGWRCCASLDWPRCPRARQDVD